VEKTVDYFREPYKNIQKFSLAKGYSRLIGNIVPYLSITFKKAHSPVDGGVEPRPAHRLAGVIHKCR
jgi:hypothetical protein